MLFQTVNTHAKPQEILPVLENHLHVIRITVVYVPSTRSGHVHTARLVWVKPRLAT